MDSSKTTNLLAYLLSRIDQDPACRLSGSEVKPYNKDLSALLSSRILQETAPAEEIICRLSCGFDCNFKVHRRRKKIFLVCPRHQVSPREIAEDEIRQYKLNLPAFISALNQTNGINPTESPHKPLSTGLYCLGTKEVKADKLTICLAFGLPQDDHLSILYSLRLYIKNGRIAVLLPSYSVTGQSLLSRLKSESIYPLALIDALETGTLKLNWDKVVGAIWTETEFKKDIVLVIDTKKHLVLYKNQSVTLQPLGFKLLHLLAMYPGDVIPRNKIYQPLWGHTAKADNPTYDRQIDDHKRKIQTSLHGICTRKTGITQKEIAALIITHKKVGLQLNLSPRQVEIK